MEEWNRGGLVRRLASKKEVRSQGDMGEKCVDAWMASCGWQVALQNYRFRGGELDRLYRWPATSPSGCGLAGLWAPGLQTGQPVRFCVAEIKTRTLRSVGDVEGLLCSASALESVLRVRQMRNLLRFGESLAARGEVYLRVFVVMRFIVRDGLLPRPELEQEIAASGIRLCHKTPLLWIVSITPEFAPSGARAEARGQRRGLQTVV